MKRVIFLLAVFASMAFGFNYNGVWKNVSATNYNDPILLKISGHKVTPILKKRNKRVSLKAKEATNVGCGLYEAWGHGYRNLVLLIKPINSYKLKVIAKKINTKAKKIHTKTFIFTKKRPPQSIKKRFIGNYKSTTNFTAIKKITIREVDGKLFVRAWRHTRYGLEPLGVAKAKFYNNKLHLTWSKGNLVVEATIRGYNYSPSLKRYKNLELDVKATNIKNGLTNRQIIQLRRVNVDVPQRPVYKRVKIGPVDVNLMINSY